MTYFNVTGRYEHLLNSFLCVCAYFLAMTTWFTPMTHELSVSKLESILVPESRRNAVDFIHKLLFHDCFMIVIS